MGKELPATHIVRAELFMDREIHFACSSSASEDEHSFTFAGICYDCGPTHHQMKISRRLTLSIAISVIVLPGVVAILLMPSSVEGVYNPLSISSTMGCDCDQFEEIRDGRMLFHVMDGTESFLHGFYKKDPSGSIVFTSEDGTPYMRAEAHLLGTRFYYPDSGKSEWRWKRFVSRNMKDHMAGVKIKDIVREKDGLRFITYDHDFKILNTKFYPKLPARPAVPP